MDLLETLLEKLSVNSDRAIRTLMIGTNLSKLNDLFKTKFSIGFINDTDESSYLNSQRFVFRLKIAPGKIKKYELIKLIQSKGKFNEIYLYCCDSAVETLSRWLKDDICDNIKVIHYGEEDSFITF
mmetsp:Transcript_30616/g.41922  ORF Transcript_30616/g.41922 Transcript_30616/m.41922 type:complete len:126 (-) Transcript_30616:62-439(-)|eukprot:CAMPEP_0170071538 /NCGR_PEP_ID=MMETSP0019_2-20121128/9436_1 /TAXON_ID=98059 /ORGANISM="Dinobryon sp., Strain UTEXLB2267" /LENGTH=125 /DNA_ID=CAMNT_0010280129 /DNA_START=335 /DNA_END=712 /DNA_ORIENTATION=-